MIEKTTLVEMTAWEVKAIGAWRDNRQSCQYRWSLEHFDAAEETKTTFRFHMKGAEMPYMLNCLCDAVGGPHSDKTSRTYQEFTEVLASRYADLCHDDIKRRTEEEIDADD